MLRDGGGFGPNGFQEGFDHREACFDVTAQARAFSNAHGVHLLQRASQSLLNGGPGVFSGSFCLRLSDHSGHAGDVGQ